MINVVVSIAMAKRPFHKNQPNSLFVTEKGSTLYSPGIVIQCENMEEVKLGKGLDRLIEAFEEKGDQSDLIMTPKKMKESDA